MPLHDRAVLEIDLEDADGTVHTGAFQLQEDLQFDDEVSINYLLSNRGALLREAYDIGTDLLPEEISDADLERRKGYHVDGGAGLYSRTLTATVHRDESPWGDGSSSGDYTMYDAPDAPAKAKQDVLEWYASQPRQGSTGTARLYVSEWSDGTYADSAGVFGEPMRVAIQTVTITNDPEQPGRFEVTLELAWTSVFPDAVSGTLDNIANFLSDKE